MSNDRLSLYREALDLEAKRASLQEDLERITSRLAQIRAQLFSGDTQPAAATNLSKATASMGSLELERHAEDTPGSAPKQSGQLKARIISLLAAADQSGLTIKDLARTLETTSSRIHSWFTSSGMRIQEIKRLGRTHYRLEGIPPRRGRLSAKIDAQLRVAGKAGMTCKELAARIGIKRTRVAIWFATTGKKDDRVKKIGPAHYRLELA